MAVDGHIGRTCLVMRRVDRRNVRAVRKARNRYVIPGRAMIVRELDQAVVGACPDRVSVYAGDRDRFDGIARSDLLAFALFVIIPFFRLRPPLTGRAGVGPVAGGGVSPG